MRFRHRVLLVLVAVGAAGALLMAVASVTIVRRAVRERFVERAHAETALLSAWAAAVPSEEAQAFAEATADKLGVRVTLIAADGTVVGDSAKDRPELGQMEHHDTRPEIRAARDQGRGESFRTSATTGEEYFYCARRLSGGGYVRIAVPARQVDRVQERYATLVGAMLALAVVVSVGLAYGVVRRISKPVEWIAEAVERASERGASPEVPSEGPEEVERLATAVRRMQRTLLAKIAELDAERAVLDSVVSGMKEGLLLLGPDSRVRLANAALRRVLDLRFDPRGHQLTEVVRDPGVIADVETALRDRRPVEEPMLRLPGANRAFELHVTPLAPGDDGAARGVLVLFFDVSRLEALEGVRREFVANVSHELRTPLTSIRASVENLLDPVPPDRETTARFLEVVRRNAEHMGDLIEDLTDLSLIETGSIRLELRAVDAGEVAREVVERLRPVAEENEIGLTVEMPHPLTVIADRRRLEQMLTNLVDNAVKYNRAGGRVLVGGDSEAGLPRIYVEDTGQGIPADSREKVFHRFYRVARDRSGVRRSTGLGLAIVKHLMRLHGGSVTLESELGQGSRFTLEFPGAA